MRTVALVRSRRMERGRFIVLAAAGLAALVAGCGGGDSSRQDADEPEGTWTVAIPNVAVTVDSFSRRSEQPGLADPNRPVWIVDDGPRGGTTAYTNTWTLGRMAPGQTKTFEWRVTPVEAGTQRVSYRIAAGLDGKALARLDGGERPEGTFTVRISKEPSQSRVEPDSGDVIRD